jgi:phenylacetate-CoA ligase
MLSPLVKSCLPGIVWPGLPEPAGAAQLALLYQFSQSERWSTEELVNAQYRQLDALIKHAWHTSPFYRNRFAQSGYDPSQDLNPSWFTSLPLLSWQALQSDYDQIVSTQPPVSHGATIEGASSGSTGRPIRFLSTEYTRTIWRTLSMRSHLWNSRDFSAKFAVIRAKVKNQTAVDWGVSMNQVFDTAPSPTLDIRTPVADQATWLLGQNPHYLLTFPSNLRGLAERFLLLDKTASGIEEIITIGEMLTPENRAFCEQVFKAPIRDVYSASEVGYIAFQCQEGHYHVQENLLVEVLDEEGKPVPDGKVGQVVITDLHNFASPLIRYAIGDYAEKGNCACKCGRKLMQLNQVMGRSRNLITLPNGNRFWPLMAIQEWPKSAGITRHQVIQKSLDLLEVRLEVPRPLTDDERNGIATALCGRLGHQFDIQFAEMASMPMPDNGKFEDFISEISQ